GAPAARWDRGAAARAPVVAFEVDELGAPAAGYRPEGEQERGSEELGSAKEARPHERNLAEEKGAREGPPRMNTSGIEGRNLRELSATCPDGRGALLRTKVTSRRVKRRGGALH